MNNDPNALSTEPVAVVADVNSKFMVTDQSLLSFPI